MCQNLLTLVPVSLQLNYYISGVYHGGIIAPVPSGLIVSSLVANECKLMLLPSGLIGSLTLSRFIIFLVFNNYYIPGV